MTSRGIAESVPGDHSAMNWAKPQAKPVDNVNLKEGALARTEFVSQKEVVLFCLLPVFMMTTTLL